MISKLHKDNKQTVSEIKEHTPTHLTHIHPTTKLASMMTFLEKQLS